MNRRWTRQRIVAFDTETTGLNVFDGDRVVEFGAVELMMGPDGGVEEVQHHQFFINPGIPIPRAASKISGITDDDVADAPPFDHVADRVRKILADSILIAHNLSFDRNFLRVELERVGRYWPLTRAEVDTLPLSQRLMPKMRSHRLEAICKELGVPLDNAHRASHDAEACGRVLVEIARRHGAPEDLQGFVEWADAVSPPPDTGHVDIGPDGGPRFLTGKYKGEAVERHPDHLEWMILALERRGEDWHQRFPESVRHWARRWLRARAAGRGRTNPRSQGNADWTLEPPIRSRKERRV
jgi:DNA polymerase III epsilon subunit